MHKRASLFITTIHGSDKNNKDDKIFVSITNHTRGFTNEKHIELLKRKNNKFTIHVVKERQHSNNPR